MKALVAAACIAIIAAVGYYFWQEHQRSLVARGIAAASARREAAVKALFDAAGARPFEASKVRKFCAEMDRQNETAKGNIDALVSVTERCRALGYLDSPAE